MNEVENVTTVTVPDVQPATTDLPAVTPEMPVTDTTYKYSGAAVLTAGAIGVATGVGGTFLTLWFKKLIAKHKAKKAAEQEAAEAEEVEAEVVKDKKN